MQFSKRQEVRNQVIINGSLFEGLHLALAKFETETQMGKGTPPLQVKLKVKKKALWECEQGVEDRYSS